MDNHETSLIDPYAFNAQEVVGDDANVLKYHIPDFIGKIAVESSQDD